MIKARAAWHVLTATSLQTNVIDWRLRFCVIVWASHFCSTYWSACSEVTYHSSPANADCPESCSSVDPVAMHYPSPACCTPPPARGPSYKYLRTRTRLFWDDVALSAPTQTYRLKVNCNIRLLFILNVVRSNSNHVVVWELVTHNYIRTAKITRPRYVFPVSLIILCNGYSFYMNILRWWHFGGNKTRSMQFYQLYSTWEASSTAKHRQQCRFSDN